MTITANDNAAAQQEASREAARRELEAAREIAKRIPMTRFSSGLGPPKVDKTR